jgi:chitinase
VPIGPGNGTYFKEAQVRIGINANVPAYAWDPTNDWSYQGLLAGNANLAKSPYIPVYENGSTLLYGQTPSTTSLPGAPQLSVGDVSVREGNSGTVSAVFTVTLSAPSSQTVTVAYATQDGTATAGGDYQATSGTLTFAPGETAKTIAVAVNGDTVPEPDETFRLILSNATNAVIAVGQATGTILNDDGPPPSSATVTFTKTSVWDTGFTADMTITNRGTTAIAGWTLEFDLAADIVNIWNAVIVSHVGTHYVIRNAAWNATIAAGGTASFGFQAATTTAVAGPTNIKLNGVAV